MALKIASAPLLISEGAHRGSRCGAIVNFHVSEMKAFPIFIATLMSTVQQGVLDFMVVLYPDDTAEKEQTNEIAAYLISVVASLPSIAVVLCMLLYLNCLARGHGAFKNGMGSGAYISFSLHFHEHRWFKCLGMLLNLVSCGVLCVALMFSTHLGGVLMRGAIMLWSLHKITVPQFPSQAWLEHQSGIEQWQFKRSRMEIFVGTNEAFTRRLIIALWEAKFGHWSALETIMDYDDPTVAAHKFLDWVSQMELSEE